MIAVEEESSLLLITQGDHAHFAAELLSLCRFPELADHPRRPALLEATREHDNGWREIDAAPSIDPDSGEPHTFRTLPDRERRELWLRASDRFRDEDPYVALLITEHALALHRQFAGQGSWTEWLVQIEGRRSELLDETDCPEEALATDYDLLRFADLSSLAACTRSPETFEHRGVRGRFSGQTLYLDPLPLVARTTFRVACRRIPRKSYVDSVQLGVELATARWHRQTVHVAGEPR